MLILSCNILLLLCYYFEFTYGLDENSIEWSSSLGLSEDIKNIERQGIPTDPFTTKMFIYTPMDHYNNDGRLWRMKYYYNYKYYKPNGPIIFQIGPEAPSNGTFYYISEQLAKETGGILFNNEHRYYGDSFAEFPSLDYLSSKQSLADIAFLIKELKPWYNMPKVVVVGASYGGNLAAWMRLRYPDLVDAAHASSAPLIIKSDFPEYLQNCSDILKTFCAPYDYEGIKNRFEYLDTLSKNFGVKWLEQEVGVCPNNDLRPSTSVHHVFHSLAVEVCKNAGIQNGDMRDVKYRCKQVNYNINNRKTGACKLASFEQQTRQLKMTNNWRKSWSYQQCNEFGYFVTLSSTDQIFTQNLPVEHYYAYCREVFGPEFTVGRINQGIEETNRLYGGLNRKLTRVVFVNGELDPWSHLSVLEDLSPEAPALVIPGGSHCEDLHRSWKPEVVKAQELSKSIIKKWIGL